MNHNPMLTKTHISSIPTLQFRNTTPIRQNPHKQPNPNLCFSRYPV